MYIKPAASTNPIMTLLRRLRCPQGCMRVVVVLSLLAFVIGSYLLSSRQIRLLKEEALEKERHARQQNTKTDHATDKLQGPPKSKKTMIEIKHREPKKVPENRAKTHKEDDTGGLKGPSGKTSDNDKKPKKTETTKEKAEKVEKNEETVAKKGDKNAVEKSTKAEKDIRHHDARKGAVKIADEVNEKDADVKSKQKPADAHANKDDKHNDEKAEEAQAPHIKEIHKNADNADKKPDDGDKAKPIKKKTF